MALRNKGGRMLKVALKESTLDIVDREMPEKESSVYSPTKQKDESLASLLSEEDLYSEYDDEGNKITSYSGKKQKTTSYESNIICIFLLLIVIIAFMVLFVCFL